VVSAPSARKLAMRSFNSAINFALSAARWRARSSLGDCLMPMRLSNPEVGFEFLRAHSLRTRDSNRNGRRVVSLRRGCHHLRLPVFASPVGVGVGCKFADNEALSAVASAASPLTRSVQVNWNPFRFPFATSVIPSGVNVSVYGAPAISTSRFNGPSSLVVIVLVGGK